MPTTTAAEDKTKHRSPIPTWRSRVRAILRHLTGGPACTPDDLRSLHIVLRQPTRPLRSPDFERKWQDVLESEGGKSQVCDIEDLRQRRYGPTPKVYPDWCGGALKPVLPYIKRIAPIIWGKSGSDYTCSQLERLEVYMPKIPARQRKKNKGKKGKTVWRPGPVYRLNRACLQWDHGKDRLIRTMTAFVPTQPASTHITAQELFSLATAAISYYSTWGPRELVTVRVLSISDTFIVRFLKATIPLSYILSLVATPSSPYADLDGGFEIEQSPYFDALDPDGLADIMRVMFENTDQPVDIPPAPAIPSTRETVLQERSNIPTTPQVGTEAKKRRREKEHADGIDTRGGDTKRQRSQCDIGRESQAFVT